MGYVEIIIPKPEELDTCDSCGNQGLNRNGQYITDSYGENVMWFCFNCKEKMLHG
jgi:hypothetical protein